MQKTVRESKGADSFVSCLKVLNSYLQIKSLKTTQNLIFSHPKISDLLKTVRQEMNVSIVRTGLRSI